MERVFIRFTIADIWEDPMISEHPNVYIEVEWPYVPRKGEVVHLSDDEAERLSALILEFVPSDRRLEDDNYSPDDIPCYRNVTWPNLYAYDEIEKKRYVLVTLTKEDLRDLKREYKAMRDEYEYE